MMKIAGRLENYLFHYVLKTLQSQAVSEIPGTGVLFRTALLEWALQRAKQMEPSLSQVHQDPCDHCF